MKPLRTNKRLRLSPNRAMVSELMRISRHSALVSGYRDMKLPNLAALRRTSKPRIAWAVVLMKAYAHVSLRHPPLRQVYVNLPIPHLYEHSDNICFMAIERQWKGRDHLFYARFPSPEFYSLAELQQQLEDYWTLPVEQIRQYRHQLALATAPFPLRRLGSWLLMHLSPKFRVQNLGTYGMSIISAGASRGLGLVGPQTSLVGYANLHRNGDARVVYSFDHRVMDGKLMARVLSEMEAELQGPLTEELRELAATE